MALHAIILAAGKGTRMKSELLKVAHLVAGKPIVEYVVDTVRGLGVDSIYIVVGHQAEVLKKSISDESIHFVMQADQLGTGHAVMQVGHTTTFTPTDHVLVLAGDCPLIDATELQKLMATHIESNAYATILTTKMEKPGTYGRILRGQMGSVIGIREAKDCDATQLGITEVNTGVYVFQAGPLFNSLAKITTNNSQHEYYLTDVIHILKRDGHPVSAYQTARSDTTIGVNTRADLAMINQLIYQQNNEHVMKEGVTIIDPSTTFIDSTASIGLDTIIHPFTVIYGHTQIGCNCIVGPHVYMMNATVESDSYIPPFTRLE